jgi:uncharacterized lipoprotein YbaY
MWEARPGFSPTDLSWTIANEEFKAMNRYFPMPTPASGLFVLSIVCLVSAGSLHAQYLGDNQLASTTSSWGSGWGSDWSGNGWSHTNSGKQWTLGISGTNTTTGVIVDQISPNSAAARAGINLRDVILCVAGRQVGQVEGKLFDVSEELNRNADASGRVPLLIQDSRTLQLKPMTVQLDDRQGGLSGALYVRDRGLPPNALVTVQLENVSRPHYAVRNGAISFRTPSYAATEVPFSLNFDPRYIFPEDTYLVRAFVTSSGRTLYDTTQPPYVLTRGNPKTVRLMLAPVSFSSAGDLAGTGSGSVVTAGYASYDAISQRVTTAYQRYLGRSPTTIELAAWQQLPDIDYRLGRMPLELMASQEYYDLVGNNNVVWVRTVFNEVIGRVPSTTELDQWMRRFADLRYSRMELLNQLQSVARR